MIKPLELPKRRTPWTQRAVAFGVSVQSWRVARRMHSAASDFAAQEKIRERLLCRIAATAFGEHEGITAGMSWAEFQRRVRPRTYELFAPWIHRAKKGEPDVLWPGQCARYAVSSGTTEGRTKYLPVTNEMLRHFRRTGLDSLCLYARRTGRASVFRGRHLFLGGSTSLSPIRESEPFAAVAGDLSGITALNLPRWVEQHLYEPGREISQMSDWPGKLRAIAERTVARDIRLLAGIPSWILILAETIRAHTGRETLKDVWPDLECLIHGGVPLAPYLTELTRALGPGVNLHEVYPASEGFIAAQDVEAEAGLRLFSDAGIFYEFLPMARFDETRLHELGGETVPLSGVRAGMDYAVLMTTPAGLCRYVIGDVVRFVSVAPPRLIYVGRTRLQLSGFGEHVTEKELTDALTTVCARRELIVGNFHVAPRFMDGAGSTRGRHEWWIELKSPGAASVEPKLLATALDQELQRLNDDYEAKRIGSGLDVPIVRLVPEGAFERWLRRRGKWGGQNKTPRCRSDREIADDLAAMLAERS
jgi:hypothetical protein